MAGEKYKHLILGTKINDWTIVSNVIIDRTSKCSFECECICGNKSKVSASYLLNKRANGCGCTLATTRKKFEGVGDLSKSYYGSILKGARNRRLSISDDMTMEYLWELFKKQKSKCALSGVDITLNRKWSEQKKGINTLRPQTASLDRINSSKGYIIGNIQWVHKTINLMKMNLKEGDFIDFCSKVCVHSK